MHLRDRLGGRQQDCPPSSLEKDTISIPGRLHVPAKLSLEHTCTPSAARVNSLVHVYALDRYRTACMVLAKV